MPGDDCIPPWWVEQRVAAARVKKVGLLAPKDLGYNAQISHYLALLTSNMIIDMFSWRAIHKTVQYRHCRR